MANNLSNGTTEMYRMSQRVNIFKSRGQHFGDLAAFLPAMMEIQQPLESQERSPGGWRTLSWADKNQAKLKHVHLSTDINLNP